MYTGPHIIKDGLVFGYDTGYGIADNTTATRFYPGGPTTNVVTNRLPTTGWSTANAQGSSITRTFLTENGIPFMRFSNVTNGNDYPRVTDSVFYNSATVTGAFSTSLEVRGTAGASLRFRIYQNGSTKITNTVTLTSDWVRYTFDNQTTSFNLNQPYFNPVTTGATYDIRNIQIESKSYTTPFVDGTRSSTASLIDLEKTTDIDVSNVSFDSTGQPTFDGSGDRISMNAQNLVGATAGTVSAWVNLAQANVNHAGIFCCQVGPAWADMRVVLNVSNPNRIRLAISDGTNSTQDSCRTNSTLSYNTWYHIAATYDGTSAKIYVNGVLDETHNTTIRPGTFTPGATMVGYQNYSNRYFNGDIAAVSTYDIAMTATEVKQNFNAHKNRFDI